MQVLDTSIANVALRNIAGSLAAGIDESTWVITTYLIASAVIVPISGWLLGVVGRKRFYMICVALFTASSLLCGLAPSLSILIFFRIIQGLGGGGMVPSEQAILADTFPPQRRAQGFALYGIAVIVAPTVGPTIGGWITDQSVVALDLLHQRTDRHCLPGAGAMAAGRAGNPGTRAPGAPCGRIESRLDRDGAHRPRAWLP
jgi:EmrB/QacA subfamily drug resistance transporter